MSEVVIRTSGLTKDYGGRKGIFNLDLEVRRGEVYGFIGTNGSGKTTTIRNMMGFITPDSGTVEIFGRDAWKEKAELKKYVSYVPGEIFFPSVGSGTNFLKLQAEYLGLRDFSYVNDLIQKLQLDPTANLKKMSKGMKQKTAIVAALMGDKEILILDEPTTGLDPLMREVFLDLIREEKRRGKTIFMSSHIFEEMEDVCDRVSMIRDGSLMGTLDLAEMRRNPERVFDITYADGRSEIVTVPKQEIQTFLEGLRNEAVEAVHEKRKTLQDEFMNMYKEML